MNKIKIKNDEWICFSMLFKYATTCFEVLMDPYGASCIIFKRKVIGFTKVYSDEFHSHLRIVFVIRGGIEIDISKNKLYYTNVKNFELLSSLNVFSLLSELHEYTGENFFNNIWDC